MKEPALIFFLIGCVVVAAFDEARTWRGFICWGIGATFCVGGISVLAYDVITTVWRAML